MVVRCRPTCRRIVAVVALSTLLTVVSLVSIVTWTSRRSSSSALHASCERRPAIAASGSSPGDLPSNRTTTSALASSWPQTLSVAWPFSRYVAFHAERRRAPHARYLVWQCPAGIWKCGGIGDRARGIVYAFLLAVATERVFLIDLPANPVPLSETVRPNALDWLTDTAAVLALHDNVTIATRSGSTNPLLVHNMTEGALASAPVVIVRTSFEGWCTAVLEVGAFAAALDRFGVPNGPDVCRSGLLAELMLTWAWTTLMRPSPALLQATDAMRARLGVAGHEYVAVHMRGGDGEFRMNHERHRPETVVEFAACARTVGRVISGDKPRRLPVVVVSDTPEYKARFAAALGDDAARYETNEPFHVDRGLMHEGDPSPANLLTWAEWLLLAQARCIVTSSSGFSRLAVAASRHPGTGARCAFHFQACDEADVVAGWQ
ncbi:t-SNARE coiled-coil homology domain-containing protein [Plasmodiophora brassicae]